ncbi:MAG: RluA family pseudouridine synthase [Treponema sp.]|nr:RluA family pseudouridine synthase [Treponema sp.]
MPCFEYDVPSDFSATVRLDKYISQLSDGMNRSQLKNGVTDILVNARKAKLSYKVQPGDHITIQWEDSIPDDIQPEDIPLHIIYEDDNVTVVNKEQGMVTHPAAGNWTGTLVNALLYHWGATAVKLSRDDTPASMAVAMRPGIVHRLDKDTSGIIITAKNRHAEEWLQTQFQKRLVKKEYIAIVYGKPPHRVGDIKTGFIRDPKNRQLWKAVPDTAQGKYARTLYEWIASYGPYSLMRLRLKTGRTHQIRVHMKYLGCPIVGDPLYNTRKDVVLKNATLQLHSRLLAIRLPDSKKVTVFGAAVPPRFKEVLHILHALYQKETPHE